MRAINIFGGIAQHHHLRWPSQVVVLGDTPKDIDCAHHHGCRCLATATGAFTVDELSDADVVFADLAESETVYTAILKLAGM